MGDAAWLEEPVHSGSVMESVRSSASWCGRRRRTSLSTTEKILKNPKARFTAGSASPSAYTAVRWSPKTGEGDSREKGKVEKSTRNKPRKFSECISSTFSVCL
ncbi:uncharacterized protein ACIBXB_019921 isoform 2-T3 [Morphnus guianensis]